MAYLEGEYAHFVGNMGEYDRFDPLLVALHDNLKAFKADQQSVQLYTKLQETIIEMLTANLQKADHATVVDVIIDIIKQAKTDVQKNLSESLSEREDLPQALLHYLAYEGIHIARPILLNSSQLSEVDILYIVQAKGADHWEVIASRPNITDDIIACLTSKKHTKTNINLLDNESIVIADQQLEVIAKGLDNSSEDLATRLINYKTLPAEIASSIYWNVSNAVRNEIKEIFNIETPAIDHKMEACAQDFIDTVFDANDLKPTADMVATAAHFAAENKITSDRLIDCLRRRQARFFVALFAKKSKLSHNVVVAMLRQKGGQGLAVACRATSISKKDFVSLFLLTGTLLRSSNPINADELRMAIRYYEGLSYKIANDILSDSICV